MRRDTVDDAPFIVQLVVRMLTARGHVVESASNGSVGLARLTEVMGTALDFDFVLCDFQMPVRDKARVDIPAMRYALQVVLDSPIPYVIWNTF